MQIALTIAICAAGCGAFGRYSARHEYHSNTTTTTTKPARRWPYVFLLRYLTSTDMIAGSEDTQALVLTRPATRMAVIHDTYNTFKTYADDVDA